MCVFILPHKRTNTRPHPEQLFGRSRSLARLYAFALASHYIRVKMVFVVVVRSNAPYIYMVSPPGLCNAWRSRNSRISLATFRMSYPNRNSEWPTSFPQNKILQRHDVNTRNETRHWFYWRVAPHGVISCEDGQWPK